MWQTSSQRVLSLLLLLLLGVAAASAARSPSSSSRSVSVSMHAPWPTLPLSPALEASEFFAEASQASFWEFAKRIGQRLGAAEGTASTESEESDADVGGVPVDTADGVLAHTLITARGMVPPLYHKVLEVSLDTRAFAPAVEAQRQVAEAALRQADGRCTEQFEKGDAWAVISWPGVAPDVDGHPVPVCTASDLEAALEHAKPVQDFSLDMSEEVTTRITRHDHVFPSRTSLRSSQSAPTVFVYGLLGTTSFKKFHGALERLVSNGLVTYVYRHAPSPISSDRALPRTYLRGFGVTLDLKSMEYKALDDRALGGDNDDDDDDGDGGNGEDGDGSEGDPANGGPSAIADDEELFGIYFRKLLDRHPSMEAPLRSFRDTLLAEQKEGVGGDPGDMKVWDMKDLGLQAAQSIRAAKDPLKHLGEISQNFPLYARRLIGVSVEDKLRRQAQAVSRSMEAARPGAGTNSVLLNGQTIDAGSDGFNVFELLTAILGEASSQSRFARLGLAPEVLEKVKEAAENPGPRFGSDLNAMIGMRVDTRSGSKGCIYYMNNLEKDKAYAQWPKQVANLMQQAFQLFAVRKNLYTGVFVLDPTTPVGLGAIRSMLRIKDMNIPLRFGIAMVPSNVHTRSINSVGDSDGDNGVTYDGPSADDPRKATVSDIVRLVASAKKKSGTGAANAFLAELSKVETFPLSRASVIAAFATGLKAQTGTWSGSSHIELAETTLGSDKYGNVPMKIESYVRAKGLAVNSYAINGKVHDSVGTLEQDLMQVIFAEQQRMQQLVQRGIVRDKTNAYAYFTGTDKKKKKSLISSAFAFSHYDARILVDDQNAEFVPLVAAGSGGAKAEEVSSPASVHPQTLLLDPERKTEVPYFTSKNFIAEKAPSKIKLGKKKKMSGSFVPVTHWIIADFCTDYGLSLAASAVERLPGSDGAVRIALFHRGETKDSANGACLDADNVKTTLGLDIANRLSSPPGGSHAFVSAALSSVLPPDVRGPCVITNGRLVRLAASNIPFTKASFMLLEKYENVRMITRLHRALRRSSASYKTATAQGGGENDQAQGSKNEDQKDFSNEDMPSSTMSPHELIMRVNSLVSQQSKSKRQKPAIKPARAKKRLDAVSFSSESGRNDMQVVAVVDPLSVAAQRITPTLLMLRDVFNMSVSVILNPATDITEFPLKNFYRFVPTRVRGSQHGDDIVDMIGQKVAPKKGKAAQRAVAPWGSKDASATKFRRLPKQHVLTLKLVTPEAWVAMKYKVEDDLDNIRLDDATMGSRRQVNADFRLTSLLIAGTCTDLTHHKPPNGLQLVLQFMDGSDPSRNTDTLVMQNLGYFQLQAQPGVWTLRLDEGRASELYALAPPGKF